MMLDSETALVKNSAGQVLVVLREAPKEDIGFSPLTLESALEQGYVLYEEADPSSLVDEEIVDPEAESEDEEVEGWSTDESDE